MGVSAAVAAVVGSTIMSSENANRTRRAANQRANGMAQDQETARRQTEERERQESNRAFSKIQKQRQRAMAAGGSVSSIEKPGSIIGAGLPDTRLSAEASKNAVRAFSNMGAKGKLGM